MGLSGACPGMRGRTAGIPLVYKPVPLRWQIAGSPRLSRAHVRCPRRNRGVMPRKFLNKLLPDREALYSTLNGKWYARPFQELLHDPVLWHVNRRGSCGALALGLFICCLPIPGHMLLAVLGALYWRLNIPIAVASVWVNNPLTIGPIYYFSYRLGAHLLHQRLHHFPDALSIGWLVSEFSHIWEPLWLGCVIVGSLFAVAGYFGFHIAWQISIRMRWLRRRERLARKPPG